MGRKIHQLLRWFPIFSWNGHEMLADSRIAAGPVTAFLIARAAEGFWSHLGHPAFTSVGCEKDCGRNPKKLATNGNYETLKIMGINHLPSDAGFLPSTVWWGTSTMAADKWQSEDGPELRSTPKTNDYLVARDLFVPNFSASSSLQMSSANPHHHLRTNAKPSRCSCDHGSDLSSSQHRFRFGRLEGVVTRSCHQKN